MLSRQRCQPRGALLPELRINRPLRRQGFVKIRGLLLTTIPPSYRGRHEQLIDSYSVPWHDSLEDYDRLIDARAFAVGFLANSFRSFGGSFLNVTAFIDPFMQHDALI
jgi:hypothetical protein